MDASVPFTSIAPTDEPSLALFYQLHPVPQHFNAGIVVSSIVVSVLGSYTTLLLLGRRTATNGARNWGLLVLAATTMASVGIWSMHFLGMNMALQASPVITWYIQFSAGFTVLSLFVPLVALVLAFVFVGAGPGSIPAFAATDDYNNDDKSMLSRSMRGFNGFRELWRLVSDAFGLRLTIGGVLFGGTVALMHYCAAFNASFRPVYTPVQTTCAIILACLASTTALLIFFDLGASGTKWYVPAGKTAGFTLGKRHSTVLTISISVMCFALCIICFIILLSDYMMRKDSRRNARRVVVASVTFDKSGRLLVKQDGMVPISVVETSVPLKDILSELDYRQPTFQWLYTLSWDWSILDPFLPRIVASSLGRTSDGKAFKQSTHKSKKAGSPLNPSKEYTHITNFRDSCIEATHSLASELGIPMNKIGVLFDNVLRTGTKVVVASRGEERKGPDDDESSMWNVAAPTPGHEGVMLFIVRELSGEGVDNHDHYSRRGYRFADTRYFSPVLADRVRVERPEIDGLFEQLKLYARRGSKPCVRPGGVYVGFFGVRPSISRQGGLDTLVYSFCHHQCPAYRLPDLDRITDEMREWVASLTGAMIKDVAALCEQEAKYEANVLGHSEEMVLFQSGLALGIDAMLANLSIFPGIDSKARLAAEVLEVPSSLDDSTEPASIIMFEAVFAPPTRHGEDPVDMPKEYGGSFKLPAPAPTFVFVPYSLFSKTQMMLLRGVGAKKFAREARAEMLKRYPVPAESLHQLQPQTESRQTRVEMMGVVSGEGEKGSVTYSGYIPGLNGVEKPSPTHLEGRKARRRASVATIDSGSRTVIGWRKSAFDDTDVRSTHTLRPRPSSGELSSEEMASREGTVMTHMGDATSTYAPGSPAVGQASNLYSPPVTPSAARTRQNPGWVPSEAAPAYSPTRAHQILGSPIRSVGPRSLMIPMQNRPHTSSGTASSISVNPVASRPYTVSGMEVRGLVERSRAIPMAVTARIRADDWHARRLDSLEHGEAAEDLLGVNW